MHLDINPSKIAVWVRGSNIVAYQSQKPHELQVHRWFLSIILDRGRTFPIQDVSVQDCPKTKLFQDFLERLVFFWSGKRYLSTTDMYSIDFTPKGFPKSHIGKNTILLPRDVTSRSDLYRKLIVATFNVTEGRGLYGGSLLGKN